MVKCSFSTDGENWKSLGSKIETSIGDIINKPNHYQGNYGMEAIDVVKNFMTEEQLLGFYLGNTLKYLLRHQKKNGLEDLKKARKNLDWLIERYDDLNWEVDNE